MAATIGYQAQLGRSTAMTRLHGSGSTRRRHAMQRASAGSARGTRQISLMTLQRLGRIAYALLLLGVVLAIIIASAARTERPEPHAWTAVTVQESGTLWGLARAHPVNGLTTAETVDLIQRSNSLDSALITPGQALRVPAPDGAAIAVASR